MASPKELAVHIVKQLVDDEGAVEADSTDEGQTTRVRLYVAEDDKGKVIGRQGKVIKAIRAVVSIAGAKTGRKVLLDLE